MQALAIENFWRMGVISDIFESRVLLVTGTVTVSDMDRDGGIACHNHNRHAAPDAYVQRYECRFRFFAANLTSLGQLTSTPNTILS